MDFKENLKAIRMDRGMTQRSLGVSLGVTPVTIGNWERGTRQPSFDLLVRLAETLKTSTDELLGRYAGKILSLEAEAIARKYASLDTHGRSLVDTVCTMEYERVQHSAKVIRLPSRDESQHVSRHRFLPKYLSPPAAGFGVPLERDDFEMILVDDNTPDDADYAVCISGDSMEPYISDGDMVFVMETNELDDGDVGIFCVNGEMYCKQYHVDDDGTLHLLSANPDRERASFHISPDSGYSVRCCGKVLLDFCVPLPD